MVIMTKDKKTGDLLEQNVAVPVVAQQVVAAPTPPAPPAPPVPLNRPAVPQQVAAPAPQQVVAAPAPPAVPQQVAAPAPPAVPQQVAAPAPPVVPQQVAAPVPQQVVAAPVPQTGTSMIATAPVAIQGPGRGNEMVNVATTSKPRLRQLQALSPQVNEGPEYMPNAVIGDWINTISKEVYGQTIYAINVFMAVSYTLWRTLAAGGGLINTFYSIADAQEAHKMMVPTEQYEIVESHDHLLLIKNPATLQLGDPILFSMTKSKLVQSRGWNSEIIQQGHPDRFAKLWKLETIPQSNKQGQPYKGVKITPEGWVPETDFNVAARVYEELSGVTSVS